MADPSEHLIIDVDDLADIKKRGLKVHTVRVKLQSFCSTRAGQSEYVLWSGRVLEELSEEFFDFERQKGIRTITELKSRWAALVQEEWEAHQEFKDDPESSYSPKDPNAHPWSDQIIALCNWWLGKSPYQVWTFSETIIQYAKEYVEDCIFELIQRQGKGIGDWCNEMFLDQVQDLRTRYNKETT